MLTVKCPECSAQFRAPEKFAGRKMRCKSCSSVLTIGEAPPPVLDEPAEADRALDETAVMGAEDRAEMAATRPSGAGAKKGKKTFKAPKKGFGAKKAGKKGGFAKKGAAAGGKQLGTKKKGSKLAARTDDDVDLDVLADEPGVEEGKSKVVVVGAIVGVLAIIFVCLLVFTDIFSGGEKPGKKKSGTVASKNVADDVDEDNTDEDDDDESMDDESMDDDDDVGDSDDDDDEMVASDEDDDDDDEDEDDEDEDEDEDLESSSANAGGAAASLIPNGFAVVSIDVGKVVGAVKMLAPAGVIPPGMLDSTQGLLALTGGSPDQVRQVSGLLKMMEFDPINDVKTVSIGIDLRDGAGALMGGEVPPVVAILDGKFSPDKIATGFQTAGLAGEAQEQGDHKVYTISPPGEEVPGYLTFLSNSRAVFGFGSQFQSALGLSDGKGESVTKNEALSSVSKNLGVGSAISIVTPISSEERTMLDAATGGDPTAESPWKFDAVSISLDTKGDGLTIDITGNTPSEEDAASQVQMIGRQVGGLALGAMALAQQLGEAGKPLPKLVGKLTPKQDGQRVRIAFDLTGKDLQDLQMLGMSAFRVQAERTAEIQEKAQLRVEEIDELMADDDDDDDDSELTIDDDDDDSELTIDDDDDDSDLILDDDDDDEDEDEDEDEGDLPDLDDL